MEGEDGTTATGVLSPQPWFYMLVTLGLGSAILLVYSPMSFSTPMTICYRDHGISHSRSVSKAVHSELQIHFSGYLHGSSTWMSYMHLWLYDMPSPTFHPSCANRPILTKHHHQSRLNWSSNFLISHSSSLVHEEILLMYVSTSLRFLSASSLSSSTTTVFHLDQLMPANWSSSFNPSPSIFLNVASTTDFIFRGFILLYIQYHKLTFILRLIFSALLFR